MAKGHRPLVALFGPTSSGKTALSVELGQRLRAERALEPVVISADSRQVYRHLDLGTSKTTSAQMGDIRHEMIDVAEPDRKFELESYVRQARTHLEHCWDRGELPLVVGGTVVYVKALLEGWDTDAVGKNRETVRRDFPRTMAADAYATLCRLDPATANRVHPHNYDTIINALAAAMTRSEANHGPEATVSPTVLGIQRSPGELDRRVANTFDDQLARGLVAEVHQLDQRYGLRDQYRRLGQESPNQVLHTHGYREFFDVSHAGGRPIDALTRAELSEVRARVLGHIRAYTRRQRAAFDKLPVTHRVRTLDQAWSVLHQATM